MAITLNEMLKNAKSAYGAGVLKDLVRQSNLLAMLPIKTVKSLTVKGLRWQALPSTGKRKIGGSYTASDGRKENIEETLFAYGGKFQIDRLITLVEPQFQSELEIQTQMLTESLTRTFNYDFVQNDHGVDPDGLEGLKKRVSNMPSRQTIDLYSGATLDVLASAANQNKFIDACHKAKKYLGNQVDAWFMNETAYVGIGQAMRRIASPLLDLTQDNYERTWETFLKGKMVDVGLKTDLSTEVIPNTEGTGGDGTTIYAVRMGNEEGLNAIQLQGTTPEPYDPYTGGEVESTPAYVKQIDWAVGLRSFSNNFSIVKITGFKIV